MCRMFLVCVCQSLLQFICFVFVLLPVHSRRWDCAKITQPSIIDAKTHTGSWISPLLSFTVYCDNSRFVHYAILFVALCEDRGQDVVRRCSSTGRHNDRQKVTYWPLRCILTVINAFGAWCHLSLQGLVLDWKLHMLFGQNVWLS